LSEDGSDGEMKQRHLTLAACAVALAIAVVMGAACGGQGEVDVNFAEETVLPPSEETALPSDLVEHRSAEAAYSISYPEGWEIESRGSTGDSFTLFSSPAAPVATLVVACYKGENQTPDSLIRQDAAIVARYGQGVVLLDQAVPIEIAGGTGKQIMYTTSFAGLTIEHIVAYTVRGECGWRLGLSTYGSGTLRAYLSLFQQVVASFRPD